MVDRALAGLVGSGPCLTRSSLAEPLAAGDAFEIAGPDPGGSAPGTASLSITAAVPTQLLVWTFAD